MRLDMESMLPRFAIVDTAKHDDNLRSRELYAGLQAGEVVISDRAYKDLDHLYDLDQRDVQWVVGQKKPSAFEVIESMETSRDNLHDEIIVLKHGLNVRRITAWVKVDRKRRKMKFLTNNREV
jgi:hypothetical protein